MPIGGRALAAIDRASTVTTAAILATVGAILTVVGLFFDYFSFDFKRGDSTGEIAFDVAIAAGMLLIAFLVLRGGNARIVGAVAAPVVVVLEGYTYLRHLFTAIQVFTLDVGGYLNLIGFALFAIGAVIVTIRVALPALGATAWSGAERPALGLIAFFLGLATAIGLGLNAFAFSFSSTDNFGSAAEAGGRFLWSAVLAFVAVILLPTAVAWAGDRLIAIGVAVGYAVFVVATGAFRIIYGETEDSLRTASGTWVLTAAGGATLLVFAYRIFVSPEDDRGVTRRARLVLDESWLRSLARCSGVLAVVGAMALAGSIFASFDTMGSGSLSDVTALLVYQAVFAAGLFLAGALIARDTSRHTGAAALVVVAVLLALPRWDNVLPGGGLAAPGDEGWLTDAGTVVAAIAATLAFLLLLMSARDRVVTAAPPAPAVLAVALLGLATATGFAMTWLRGLPAGMGTQNAFDPLPRLTRGLGSNLFVCALLCVVPVLACMTRRNQVAVGSVIGLATFVFAVIGFRLAFVNDVDFGPSAHIHSTEGTWTFLAAGFVLLAALALRLVTTRPRAAMADSG